METPHIETNNYQNAGEGCVELKDTAASNLLAAKSCQMVDLKQNKTVKLLLHG
jgi:hypothetical protein